MVNSLCVIFGEVDDSGLCFSKAIAAGSFEEGRSGCKENAMDWVSFCATNNGQI
jgi:hypothetical protein